MSFLKFFSFVISTLGYSAQYWWWKKGELSAKNGAKTSYCGLNPAISLHCHSETPPCIQKWSPRRHPQQFEGVNKENRRQNLLKPTYNYYGLRLKLMAGTSSEVAAIWTKISSLLPWILLSIILQSIIQNQFKDRGGRGTSFKLKVGSM